MILRFGNGTPEQQAFVAEALLGTGGLDSLVRSLPHTVTVEFVDNPGPGAGSHDFFAYTTVSASTATVQFDTVFPNYAAPFDGEAFARETVAHEFGHILQAYLSDADRAALRGLFQPPGGTWDGLDAWEENVEEADAETIKDVLTSEFDFGSPPIPGRRKFGNRTTHHILEVDHEAWLAIHNQAVNPFDPDATGDTIVFGGAQAVTELNTILSFTHTIAAVPGTPTTYYNERTWTWSDSYDSFFGLMMASAATLVGRWRTDRPGAVDVVHHLTYNGGPWPIGTRPFPDPVDGDWSTFFMPLPTVSNPAPEDALLHPETNPASLPWTWQYSLTQFYTSPTSDGEPPPGSALIDFEVPRAYAGWYPAGIYGPWVPPSESPPHPTGPELAASIFTLGGIGRGARRSRNRIVGRGAAVAAVVAATRDLTAAIEDERQP